MISTAEIIEKWYKILKFPSEYDETFYSYIGKINVSDGITSKDLHINGEDGILNLYTVLYLCENVEKEHKKLGIPREITLDTLQDVVIWTKIWSDIKGTLYLGELSWLSLHLSSKIFRLGRLQFEMTTSHHSGDGVNAGDNVISIHIPRGERMDIDRCIESINAAKTFFAQFFPEFTYKHFICHSWLLDRDLASYLPEDSNIVRFGRMFSPSVSFDDNIIIRFIFGWDTTPENLKDRVPTSEFSKKIKDAVLSGIKFKNTFGVLIL